jgi:hypothetical protein
MKELSMSRWAFFGRVVPERIPFSIGSPITWSSEGASLGIKMDVGFSIADGQFVCSTNVTQGNADVHTLKNLIETEIRSVVDLIGYLHAVRYDVDIISAVDLEKGDRVVFGINIPVLTERRKDAKAGDYPPLGSLPGELLQAVASEPAAQIVLQEFREAMGFAIGTGFHCYRAIEAMMQSIRTSDTEKEATAWDRLRQHLSLDRAAIDFVKDRADLPRHGRPSSILDTDRAMVFKITDEIVRRYLHYLSKGKTPLPAADFPVLQAQLTALDPRPVPPLQ